MNEELPELSVYLDQDKGPYNSWDPVNEPMIRHWCEALGDANSLYTQGYAPPTMLQAWTMRGYREQRPSGSDERDPFEVLGVLEQAGYPAVVAVNCEQEYFRYLEVGDHVHFRSRIESISEEKTTALGTGFFVTEVSTFYDQQDEAVGLMRFRVFKYRPHEQAAAVQTSAKPRGATRMRPVRNQDTQFFWEGIDASQLKVQRCCDCNTLRHPPAPMCPGCQSLRWDSVTASGRGTVYSFVVMHYPEIPPFDYPNLVALIELEEGTRLVSNLVDVKRQDVYIGMPVQACFDEVEEGFRLHQFRPVESV